ncbi:chorismate synthase [Mycoplasmatota bacterium]|nr:chorismate synthase [Mycoplasmatota bacterium]
MNTVGQNIKITFFGESHSEYMGIVIDNLKPGLEINHHLLEKNLAKRRPKKDINTSRIEKDSYEFISGLLNNKTTGAPLTVLVKNKQHDSDDYPNLNVTPRPSHADMPANIKYKGFNNYYGGGMFSGRLTVLWVIVGSIAQQILEEKNIYTGSHIYSLQNIYDDTFDMNHIEKDQLKQLNDSDIPLINQSLETTMIDLIKKTMKDKDSIGGIIESSIINLPVGLGEPIFHSLESYLSYLLFSIPSVKGIEFGLGFDMTKHLGSEMNDTYYYNDVKEIKTHSNHNGGIVGGLSTGSPIVLRLAIKPIASIAKKQKTINTQTQENTSITIKGRHDSQILTRIPPVINAVMNFAIMDLLYKEL